MATKEQDKEPPISHEDALDESLREPEGLAMDVGDESLYSPISFDEDPKKGDDTGDDDVEEEEEETGDDVEEEDAGKEDPIAALSQQISQLTQRLDESEREREYMELQHDREKMTSAIETGDQHLQQYDAQLTRLRAQKAKALEDGESTRVVQIEDQMDKIRAAQQGIREARSRAEAWLEENPAPEKRERRRGPSTEDMETITAAEAARDTRFLAEWLRQNPWFKEDRQDAPSNVARRTSIQLIREGYAPDSPGHFQELSKRMKKSFPSLVRDRGARGAQTVSNGGGRRGGGGGGGGGKRMDPRLAANFARAGIDLKAGDNLKRARRYADATTEALKRGR